MFRNMFLHFLCSFCLHGLGCFGLGHMGNGFCLVFEGGLFGWEGGVGVLLPMPYFKLNLQMQKTTLTEAGLRSSYNKFLYIKAL